jgi:hypothetical protein
VRYAVLSTEYRLHKQNINFTHSWKLALMHVLLPVCLRRLLLAGRMYVQTGPTSAVEMPIYFALFQACTADYKFATQPGQRALPELGGLTLPGNYVF